MPIYNFFNKGRTLTGPGGLIVLILWIMFVNPARAQLTDQTQAPNTAGQGIALSLEQQIGAGQGDSCA